MLGQKRAGRDPSFRIKDSWNLRKRSANRDLCAHGGFSRMKLYSLSDDLLAVVGNIRPLAK